MRVSNDRPLRVFVNGCWDLMHSGHFNALRQARAIAAEEVGPEGTFVLVAGVHSNDEIRRVKGGAFVMSEEEKEALLLACKYVDEVAHGIPYRAIDAALLDRQDIRCDFVCHGDDPVVLPDGSGMYTAAREAGRYREFRRTEGISTTLLINRLLWVANASRDVKDSEPSRQASPTFQFCAITSQRLASFSNFPLARLDRATRVVYVDGDWDLLHTGHVHVLEQAKKYGDFLMVGVHSTLDVASYRGAFHPIMSTGERALSLLACRLVDDIVMEAPLRPSHDFLRALNISVVVHIPAHSDFSAGRIEALNDRWSAAVEMGILTELVVPCKLQATSDLINRVVTGIEAFEGRNAKKVEPTQEACLPPQGEVPSKLFTA